MENDEPVADACKMPSFISSFEEGRVKVSRNLSTETSFTDSKVERSVIDLNRRVTRTNSRLSLDGRDGESEERDAEGNNNNNCNGGGGERRRASAVEILRRNFGVSKSTSFRLATNSRMQCGAQHDNHEKTVNVDITNGCESDCGDCTKSDRETGEAETENEPSSTLGVQGVENITVTGHCHRKCDSDSHIVSLNESFSVKEHVYCTVYCIADHSHRKDAGHYDETVTSEALQDELETGQDAGLSPEPVPYTLEDLVDPFWDMARRLSKEQSGTENAKQHCRVCLEVKTIAPLPCCRKAVCDECLKIYISSQVGRREGEQWRDIIVYHVACCVHLLSQNPPRLGLSAAG